MPAQAQPATNREQGKTLLTSKLGPFPTYVWLLIGTVLIGAYYLYAKYKAGQSGGAGSTTGAAQVPDYIVQNIIPSSDTTAPAATPPPAPAPVPAPGGGSGSGGGGPVNPGGPMKRPRPKPPKYRTVTVDRRETLDDIADATGVSTSDLRKINGIKHSSHIHPGQKIRVPA